MLFGVEAGKPKKNDLFLIISKQASVFTRYRADVMTYLPRFAFRHYRVLCSLSTVLYSY